MTDHIEYRNPTVEEKPTWDAVVQQDVKPSEKQPSEQNELPNSSLNRLLQTIQTLTEVLIQQTAAINKLANSNALLSQAIMDNADLDEEQVKDTFLDGTPRNGNSRNGKH